MYDLVFVTQLPAFYKINLYNEIAKTRKIKVFFLGRTSAERTADFTAGQLNFEYEFLYSGDFEKRPLVVTALKFMSRLSLLKFKNLLVSGWNLPEFWIGVLFSPVRKNLMILESSVMESTLNGPKGLLKKFFLSRTSAVMASGNLHAELLKNIKYQGNIIITKGVGIINKPNVLKETKQWQGRFLYLGRLAPEKNLKQLISIFNELPNLSLTLVGNGPQLDELKALAKSNTSFISHFPNKDIQQIFSMNEVLILPSHSEPWGLVTEEALFFGLPVIISMQCGASELIFNHKNGFIFDPNKQGDLKQCLLQFNESTYDKLKSSVKLLDQKDDLQVQAYTKLVE